MKLAIPRKKIESNKKKVFQKKESYWYSEDGDLTKQLFRAAEIGDYEDMLYLLGQGADPNAENSNAETPLLIAAKEGYEDIAELLINHGADINFQNHYGETPFLCAIKEGNKKLIELLFEKGFKPDGGDIEWLAEDWDLFHFVFDEFANKIDPSTVSWGDLLDKAVREENRLPRWDILFFLNDRNAELKDESIDDICRDLLETAVNTSDVDLIEDVFEILSDSITMDAVVYPNEYNDSILTEAISGRKTDSAVAIIQSIHRHAPDLLPVLSKPRAGGVTPLMLAARLADDKGAHLIKVLLDSYEDLKQSYQSSEGKTALMSAIERENKECAELLVSAATPDVLDKQDEDGNTALILATKKNNPELVALLLEAGADIDIRNGLGETAFSLARKRGLDEIEQLLLDQM